MRSFALIFFLLTIFGCSRTDTGETPSALLSAQNSASKTSPDHLNTLQTKNIETTAPFSEKKNFKPPVEKKRKRPLPIQRVDSISQAEARRELPERINRIQAIRKDGITPDYHEPITRKYLEGRAGENPFPTMIELSRESGLTVNFDNDILNYTDRFYTNGIRIDFISPSLHANPVAGLLLPYPKNAVNYYGLSLVQNMFTPSTTKTGGILYGDRPYAAYLYLSTFKITNDLPRKYRQYSELSLGIIGPGSYGEWVQRSFHNSVPTNHEPLGWEFQIKNDVAANYRIDLDKGIWSGRNAGIITTAGGSLGTLYTHFQGGIHVRAGWFNPWFISPLPMGAAARQGLGLRSFECTFFIKTAGRVVGYNATLQGGLFNKSSVYTIPDRQISRFVLRSSAGINLSWRGLGMDVEQFLLSPEYSGGLWHKWVHIALKFSF